MIEQGTNRRPRVAALAILVLAILPSALAFECSAEEPNRSPGSPRPGLWLNTEEIRALPTEGAAWDALVDIASQPVDRPDLANQDAPENVRVLARALVHARTGDPDARHDVLAALKQVRGTERGATVLAVSRELIAYVIAADLVGLDGAERQEFEGWLRKIRARQFRGRTLRSAHEDRPNNWGTHAGATRIAVAAYLGDQDELERAAHVFSGWLGESGGWREFEFGDRSWQPSWTFRSHAVNPVGAKRSGRSIDGVLPDDQRRGGSFRWPPPKENYVYEALQGAVVQAALLERLGYPTWDWGDRALLRAFRWLHDEADFPALGDDAWLPHIVNRAYGTDFPASTPTRPGKGMGFADWTHAAATAATRETASSSVDE